MRFRVFRWGWSSAPYTIPLTGSGSCEWWHWWARRCPFSFFFSLNLANWIGFHCGGLRYRQLSSLWWSSKHRGFMHTPRNKLAVRMDWSFFFFSTHPHVLCQTQKESWGWGVRLVSFSVCPPIGLQSVTQLGRCSFRVLFEPSYAVCAIRIV